jgi:hypothetical protein
MIQLPKYKIGNKVKVYDHTWKNNNITAMEYRYDKVWSYQVGNSSWWNEENLQTM